eukprot:TRINITY_DN4534_c0_g1_i5.p1 TRINITY_DN4534_c0_g1~~TRINITY_DN4534_c0_g1_i5.p1  ORF type:complete len:223 (-),score=62.35 TRINITY_DN4534_c0_g1_i5:739-1407(-)
MCIRDSFNSAKYKVFDIALGSHKVVWELDIYEKVGKFTPLDVFVEFDIKDGVVVHMGRKVESAIVSQGKLQVKFMKGKADNPKVNAIVLVKGALEDTDYAEYQEFTKNREKLQHQKNQRIQEERRVNIERKLRAEEDLDLSSFGNRYPTGSSDNVEEINPTKVAINDFLNYAYALEAVIVGFVIIFFMICSIVLLDITTRSRERRKCSKRPRLNNITFHTSE